MLASLISAFGMLLFVEGKGFASSGVDGISAMLNHNFPQIGMQVFNFSINIPLLIAAWFILKKRYVIYTVLYIVFSTAIMTGLKTIPEIMVLSQELNANILVCAIFAGVAQGGTALMLKIGASSGGVDVISCMVQTKMRHVRVEKIIALLSYVTVIISYPVFNDFNSTLLTAIEIFVCEQVSASVLRTGRSAVKFEIITDNAEAISEDIINRLRHGATLMKGQGIFSEEEKTIIIAVVNYRQIGEFLQIISEHKGTFCYYLDVMGVGGNFDWDKDEITELDKLYERQERKKREKEQAN